MKSSHKEIEEYLENQNEQMQGLQTQAQRMQNQQQQQEMWMEQQERSMVREQLDLSEELEKINYLLRGYVWDSKAMEWIEPKSEEMVILTDYGVHLIMNTIQWYINKNTLLSNYDDETILTKMEDFATSLADVIFMESEKVFKNPSHKDCEEVLEQRIKNKIELKEYSLKLKGEIPDRDSIEKQIKEELLGRVEAEIHKIREQIVKNKLKRFELLIRTIQDAVHSTYLRAWKGQERGTLRKHTHVTESIGGFPINQRQRGGNPLSWFTGKS